ncbi:MAG: pantetheine-phosphate adenylyltransferase [Fusobacteria bacterium]|nr:pantetheine-phosphate adenylyltransferase [Fusobacteriota bacterium]
MNKVAVYAGSFDPVSNGHINIIERSTKLFDKVIIGVLENFSKSYWFSKEERIDMILGSLSPEVLSKVVIIAFDGLLVDFLHIHKSAVLIRGLRAVSDYEYEMQMHLTNQTLAHNEIETVFLPSVRENLYLSSSLIKEIAKFSGDISSFVPKYVEDKITAWVAEREK